jgi:hypothetical protein
LWTNARYVCLLKAFVYNLFALGMFAELACLFATRHPFRYLWLGALLGPSLIYLVTHVDGRYRYPVFALSALACCSFGARLLQWLRNHAVPLMRSARRGPPLPPASSGE